MRLHHVAVVCSSLENADRFYGSILGLNKMKASLLSEDFAEALFHIAQKCIVVAYGNENMLVEVFVPESPAENRAPFVHLCFVSRIKKGDSLLIFVADYDGNLFEVKERAG
jgi:catechol 2,3-dioxygenase-like lactoylglutathione lyase family enzyme